MVSIIITAYNVEDTIAKAVDSALSQTYPDIEVVVVDDCSTDSTSEILASYGDRIKVICHEVNQGAGMARRNGIKGSSGDFAITLDADDWMDDDLVSRLVSKQVETGAEIVSGGVTVERQDGAWDAHCYSDKCVKTPKERVEAFLKEKVKFMNNKLIARRLLNEVEYCERRFIEDTPTIIPMLYLADGFAYAQTVGYHYLDNPKSLTHTADSFKWGLFSACSSLDIIHFMEERGFTDLNELLVDSFTQAVNLVQASNPTKEDVAKYQDEWNYYTLELLKRMEE